MKKTALILALAIAMPVWAQEKAADKPAGQEAPKAAEPKAAEAAEPAKAAEAPKAEAPAKPAARKHSRRNEDARHCLDEATNTEIIKCAEAYL
jgi:hypothetical protein